MSGEIPGIPQAEVLKRLLRKVIVDRVTDKAKSLFEVKGDGDGAKNTRTQLTQEIFGNLGFRASSVEELQNVENDENKTENQKKLAKESLSVLTEGLAGAMKGSESETVQTRLWTGNIKGIEGVLPEEFRGIKGEEIVAEVVADKEIRGVLSDLDKQRQRNKGKSPLGNNLFGKKLEQAYEQVNGLDLNPQNEQERETVMAYLGIEGEEMSMGIVDSEGDVYQEYLERARRRGEFDGKRYGDTEGLDRIAGVQLPPEFMRGLGEVKDVESAKRLIATTFVKMSENPLFFANWWQQGTASQVESILNNKLSFSGLSSEEETRKNYQEIRDYSYATIAVLGMQTEDRNADSNSDNLGQFSPPKEMAHQLHWDNGGEYYRLLKEDKDINTIYTRIFETAFSLTDGWKIVEAFSDGSTYDSQNKYLASLLDSDKNLFSKDSGYEQMLSKGRVAMAMFEVDYMPEWIRWVNETKKAYAIQKLENKLGSPAGGDIKWFNGFEKLIMGDNRDYDSYAYDAGLTTTKGVKIGYNHPRILRPWDVMAEAKHAYRHRPEIVWGMERVLGKAINKRMTTKKGHWITLSGYDGTKYPNGEKNIDDGKPNNVDRYNKYGKLMAKIMGGPQGTEFDNMTSMDEILPLAANYWGEVRGSQEFGNFLADLYCLKADAMFFPGYESGAKQVYRKIVGLDLFSGEAEKKKALEGMLGPDANFSHGWVAELKRLYDIDLLRIDGTGKPVYPKFYNAFYRVFMDTPNIEEAMHYLNKASTDMRGERYGDTATFIQKTINTIFGIK